jgi:DNA primase
VQQPVADFSSTEYHERDIIRLLLHYGGNHICLNVRNEAEAEVPADISVAEYVIQHLLHDHIVFENVLYRKIIDVFVSASGTGKNLSFHDFVHHSDPDVSRVAVEISSTPYTLADWEKRFGIPVLTEEMLLKKAAETAIYSLKIRHLEKMISENQKQIHSAEDYEAENLLVMHQRLLQAKIFFARELGRVVVR